MKMMRKPVLSVTFKRSPFSVQTTTFNFVRFNNNLTKFQTIQRPTFQTLQRMGFQSSKLVYKEMEPEISKRTRTGNEIFEKKKNFEKNEILKNVFSKLAHHATDSWFY